MHRWTLLRFTSGAKFLYKQFLFSKSKQLLDLVSVFCSFQGQCLTALSRIALNACAQVVFLLPASWGADTVTPAVYMLIYNNQQIL